MQCSRLARPPLGKSTNAATEGPEEGYCKLAKFTDYANEKHQCGYCNNKAYYYCKRCFPDDDMHPEYAICSTNTKRTPSAAASQSTCWV